MPARQTLALMFFLVFTTSGCSAPMKKIEIKKNPHPAMRYDITMTINDAPGRFDEMVVFATYQVMNDACVPLQPGSGARLNPMTEQVLPLTRVNEHVYTATMYVDQFQDEDYYGLGVCHWTSTGVQANLRIHKVTVSPDMSLNDVIGQKTVTVPFSKLDFTDPTQAGLDSGPPRNSHAPLVPSNSFSITLAAKEHFP
jgi:hypothetical protein